MIVAGFTYYRSPTVALAEPVDVVIVGRGDRAHADALIARAPENERGVVLDYFRPFVEGQRPKMRGAYIYDRGDRPPRVGDRISHIWWKEITETLP